MIQHEKHHKYSQKRSIFIHNVQSETILEALHMLRMCINSISRDENLVEIGTLKLVTIMFIMLFQPIPEMGCRMLPQRTCLFRF